MGAAFSSCFVFVFFGLFTSFQCCILSLLLRSVCLFYAFLHGWIPEMIC